MSVGSAPAPSMATPGSLTSLMDSLVLVQAGVPAHPLLAGFAEPLNLKRWRPDQPDVPMLYNWLLPSGAQMMDTIRIRDSVGISTRIAIRYSDVEDRMAFVEAAADAYRAIADSAFWSAQGTEPAPMRSSSTWSLRTSMQTFGEEIGGVPLIGIEFVQTFFLDRHLR